MDPVVWVNLLYVEATEKSTVPEQVALTNSYAPMSMALPQGLQKIVSELQHDYRIAHNLWAPL